jgi:hypothetical protein
MYADHANLLAIALGSWAGLLLTFALWTNRDVFAPGKLLLAAVTLSFTSIAFNPHLTGVYALVALLLLIAGIIILLDAGPAAVPYDRPKQTPLLLDTRSARRAVRLVWMLSVVPITAQAYALYHFGDLSTYVAMIGLRVMSWQGLGHVRIIINTLAVLNLMYFGVLLLSRRRLGPTELLPFTMHVALVVSFGLLSGSRGATLMPLLGLVVMYNYLRRPVSAATASAALAAALMAVMALGVARSGYRLTHRGLETGFDTRGVSVMEGAAIFSYGSAPAELALSRPPLRIQYGMTYVAALTNFVPRRLWPDKPATGGIVMTRDYLGDRWRGLSNVTPGIFGEGVLNFGAAGILTGSILLIGAQFVMIALHRAIRSASARHRPRRWLLMTGCYALTLPLAAGLVFMEFANAMVNAITRVVPFLLLGFLLVPAGTPAPDRLEER